MKTYQIYIDEKAKGMRPTLQEALERAAEVCKQYKRGCLYIDEWVCENGKTISEKTILSHELE